MLIKKGQNCVHLKVTYFHRQPCQQKTSNTRKIPDLWHWWRNFDRCSYGSRKLRERPTLECWRLSSQLQIRVQRFFRIGFVAWGRSALNKKSNTIEFSLCRGCPFVEFKRVVFLLGHDQSAVNAEIQHSLILLFDGLIVLTELELPSLKIAVECSCFLADLYCWTCTIES